MRDPRDPAFVNEPHVEYEYSVENKQYRGKRISLAEIISGSEIEAVLERYPVGAVVTVYYDPNNPNNSLLERDLPRIMAVVAVGCLATIVGGPILAAILYFHGVDWLKNHVANPKTAPFVAVAGAFGLVTGLFAFAYTLMVWKARGWPTAPGRIIASGTESFRDRDMDTAGTQTLYKSFVQYTYEVNGCQYTGDRVNFGVTISSTLPGLARRMAAKYKIGDEVEVYHNPQDPTDCCLNPHSHWYFLIWAAAMAVLTLAWAVATGRI